MDPEVMAVIDIAKVPPGWDEYWVALLAESQRDAGDDWNYFEQRVLANSPSDLQEVAELFLRYVQENGKMGMVDRYVSHLSVSSGADHAAAGGVGDESTEAGEESDVHGLQAAVVQQFGREWVNWDGSEEGWGEFRDWTYAAANSQSTELYAAAYGLLNGLDARPVDERRSALIGLGFTIHESAKERHSLSDIQAFLVQSMGSSEKAELISSALVESLGEVDGADELSLEDLVEICKEVEEEMVSEA
ncbi:hypothetical protein [Lentzea sp. NEAU-D7]|uniref:hypothetical protein n=1 Tax=Lentzea sp. NEAU-D7 TaxID=2994667 RepID=UPI00224B1EF4|nr:hypothetical protein [Lentzea sp. NEAU-D7]MCX2954537.1 hypothetical protein [Lentzea sp. NEAU-D7]